MAERETPTPEEFIETGETPGRKTIRAWDDDDVERWNELKEADLREDLAAERAAQEEALAEIAAGDDLERYETVELGTLEMEVKAWLPGTVEEVVTRAMDISDQEDAEAIRDSMETMLTALAEMTTREDLNRRFWRQYYDRYGAVGMIEAVETILGPAAEEMEAKEEAVDGFREGVERPKPGAGGGTGRSDAG